ncbi:MAG: hypothetical protein ACREYC_24455 [Gammaproteobacteria bacterium]
MAHLDPMANEPGNFLALRFGDDSFESRSSRAKRQAQGIENQKGSFIASSRAQPVLCPKKTPGSVKRSLLHSIKSPTVAPTLLGNDSRLLSKFAPPFQ